MDAFPAGPDLDELTPKVAIPSLSPDIGCEFEELHRGVEKGYRAACHGCGSDGQKEKAQRLHRCQVPSCRRIACENHLVLVGPVKVCIGCYGRTEPHHLHAHVLDHYNEKLGEGW